MQHTNAVSNLAFGKLLLVKKGTKSLNLISPLLILVLTIPAAPTPNPNNKTFLQILNYFRVLQYR